MNVVRQQIVELAHDLDRLGRFSNPKMSDLTRCVHAGVGTSCSAKIDFAEDGVRGFAQVPLDRLLRVTLRLPS